MNTIENPVPEVNPKQSIGLIGLKGVLIFFASLPLIALLAITYYFMFPSPPSAQTLQARADAQLASTCRALIISQLKNPESFQNTGSTTYRNKTVPKKNGTSIQADVVSVSFIASNSFGGSLQKRALCVFELDGGKLIDLAILDK